jgi:hypothetical protein
VTLVLLLQDAALRISASEFLARLSSFVDTGIAELMDETVPFQPYNPHTDCGCGPCTIM